MNSTRLYTRATGTGFRKILAESLNLPLQKLPCPRTCQRLLNRLGFLLRKVRKAIPLKKIKETNDIFKNVHEAHQRAQGDPSILRISIDCKARVKIGPYSRGGKTRDQNELDAADHDMGGTSATPVGILEVESAQLFLNFVEGPCTSDTIVDHLDQWWTTRKSLYPQVRTIMIDLDNGPEISSRRRQFIKRMVEFCEAHAIEIELVYYPPYHSKYNTIERCFGALEQHWNGTQLKTIHDAVQWAKTMTWKSIYPIVEHVKKLYEKGKTLSKMAFSVLNQRLGRKSGIEKWSVKIKPQAPVSPG
jgi:hypothetical protein